MKGVRTDASEVLPRQIPLSLDASEALSGVGDTSTSSEYFQAYGETNNQEWRLDHSDLGSSYSPASAEFVGRNGELEISDEALIDSTLVSYSPSEDAVPETADYHAAIFHAAQTLLQNDAEVVGDRIQTSGLSEDQVEEVVQACHVLDQSLRRTHSGLPVEDFLEETEIIDGYNPEI